MKYAQLIEFLKNYGDISELEEKKLQSLFMAITVNRKEILIKEFLPCDKLFFINKGLLRTFYIDEKGREITRMIAWENRFLTNIISFKDFSENKETIECIEKSDVLFITKDDFEILMKYSLNLKCIYAEILEEYNALHISRFYHLNTSDLKLKINHLKNDFPFLINRVNDNILASFLGISRESFNRNKKLITTKIAI